MTRPFPSRAWSRRVVWSGRFSSPLGEGLDDWNAPPSLLHDRLAAARELVVLDPLSYPWRSMTDVERLVPLVVVLPDDLDARTTGLLLGNPLLSRVTPFDRLLVRTTDLRHSLQEEWRLDPGVWLLPETETTPWWLDPLARHLSGALTEVQSDVGRFLVPQADLVTSHLRDFGAHQRPLVEALRGLVRPGDLVVDVGAHVGTFAVPLAREVAPEGRVLAVEAADTAHSLLVHNTGLNDLEDVLVPVHAAVGSAGRAVVGERVPDGNTGARQLLLEDAPTADGPTVRTLDELVAEHAADHRPALVKIDVEGAELDVLEGAEQTIAEHRPLLCLEVSAPQLADLGRDVAGLESWLQRHDYRLFRVDGDRNGRDPSWRLSPLGSLTATGSTLVDVVAVPRASDRLALAEGLHAR